MTICLISLHSPSQASTAQGESFLRLLLGIKHVVMEYEGPRL